MAKTGRPRKNINKEEFEGLLEIQCTLEEVTSYFSFRLAGCSMDTIERWCKREYGQSFAEIAEKRRNEGKISIRREMFRMMQKNASVLIFMAKNYLGMSDNPQAPDAANELLQALYTVISAKND